MEKPPVQMRVSDAALLALLKRTGKISAQEATLLQQQRRKTGDSIQDLAVQQGFVTNRQIAKLHATAPAAKNIPITKTETKKSPHLSGPAVLDDLLARAISIEAGVIHIDPHDTIAQVRFRVDGLLLATDPLTARQHTVLLAHLKTKLGHAASNHASAHQGRFLEHVQGVDTAIQAAIIPTETGEKITLRLSPLDFAPQPLPALGFWGQSLDALQTAMSRPRGLVLLSGPHCSGLSTTFLHTIAALNTTNATIATVQDTVGQRINGISQVVAQPKHATPIEQIQALLHHDPDVLGIDQLHDPSSMLAAVEAASSGRLVIGTMTAFSASEALQRYIGLPTEPFLLATAVQTIGNQRVARRLCDDCKQPYRPSAAQLKVLMEAFEVKGGAQLARLYTLEKAARVGLQRGKGDRTARLYAADPTGCPSCHYRGYKGFIGLHEVMPMTPDLQKLILARADNQSLNRQAQRDGMVPIRTDALIKSFLGITSPEEALRVL